MQHARQPVSFLAISDPAAAEGFYCDVLGLTLLEISPYALVFSDGGHTLRLQIVPDHAPAPFTVYGWRVADIEADIAALAKKAVTFKHYAHLQQSASGVWTTPDGHKIAWFTDPGGNILSLTQHA